MSDALVQTHAVHTKPANMPPRSGKRKATHVQSSQLSAKNIVSSAKESQKYYNATWSVARKAPLFLRKPKFVGTGKNKKRATMIRFGKEVPVPQKTNRCSRRHPVRVLLSAAAAECAETLREENELLRTGAEGEREVAPMLPAIQPGAELLIEHALTAYAQTVFANAVDIKESVKMHKKVTKGCMEAAIEIANRRVFAAAGMTPCVVINATPALAKRSSAQKKSQPTDGAADGTAEA